VTRISVRVGVGACVADNFEIMTSTEYGSMATMSIYGFVGSFDVKLKRFQSIFVFKGEYEAVRRIRVGTARI